MESGENSEIIHKLGDVASSIKDLKPELETEAIMVFLSLLVSAVNVTIIIFALFAGKCGSTTNYIVSGAIIAILIAMLYIVFKLFLKIKKQHNGKSYLSFQLS